jgi:predicted phosphodiesterase
MDNEQLRKFKNVKSYKNIKIFSNFGEIEIVGKKVAFVHFPKVAKGLAESGKYNFVFYGHTHKPWTEIVNDCTLLNPGNVAGEYYLPTFATWNTQDDKFELIKIHGLK